MLFQGGAIVYNICSKDSIPMELREVKKSMLTYTRYSLSSLLTVNQTWTQITVSTSQCEPIYPRVLFFIRIPKSASTSFVSLLRSLAKPLSFELMFNPSGAYNWDSDIIKGVAKSIKFKKHKRIVYARHFYYVDFKLYGLSNFNYVAIIREPTSRFISSYFYYHFSTKPHIQGMLKPKFRNESLLECIARKHNGCAHNLMTKYFCGHERFCDLGNEKALSLAKENLKHKFVLIGLLEEMDLTLKVMSKLLPGYFSLASNLPDSNRNQHPKFITQEERAAIQKANTADDDLYTYAKELLHTTAAACHIHQH